VSAYVRIYVCRYARAWVHISVRSHDDDDENFEDNEWCLHMYASMYVRMHVCI
jgi:hypothetical protein